MKYLPACFFYLLTLPVVAQVPEVPHKLTVAGIVLSIRDDARREIQDDVNALTRSARHFDIKVQRARTYFPVIEQILREERVPDDFKYLVLQESALIPDAVSVSNAVGYWQFKDFTAQEMGLRIDEHIDERMHIMASTRAAARYLKKNNYYFNNWIYALQAYQMGAGAVMRSVKDYQSGARHMEITSDTYWYVKKFLAHKIAFEPAISGPADVTLVTVDVQERKTLHDLAKELQVDENDLLAYNLWMRKNNIPGDKTYTLIVPVKNNQQAPVLAAAGNRLPTAEHAAEVTVRSTRNGIPVIVAGTSDTWATLAAKTGVSLRQLLRYNDCTIADPVIAGNFYYTKPKKNRTEIPALHVVQPGQSLWAVSQQYGIALKKLQRLNPAITGTPAAGTTVYLVSIPRHVPAPEQVAQVDAEAPFAWAAGETPKVVAVPTEIPALPRDNAPAQPQATTPKDMHRVEAGQTLYGIARSYNLTPADLLAWNNLTVTEPLKPGQLLRLSPPEKMLSPQAENHTAAPHSAEEAETNKTSAGFIVYEVKPADTLYSIARQHGVTIKELMEWNGKKDFAVAPGEKLKIASK